MKAVVLNLARRPERLHRFMGWNACQALRIEVAAAVDGAALDRAALADDGVLAADADGFGDGAIGNALSHRAQWLACAAENRPRLVFEDDACLRGDFAAQAAALAAGVYACDLLFLGYNTDAPLTVVLPDRMMSAVNFGVRGAADADFFAAFARRGPRPRPALHPVACVWGTIAYVVWPAGARRLLSSCFPLSGRRPVQLWSERRSIRPTALDGMINVALQAGEVRGLACFPPLALSPNDLSDTRVPAPCGI